MTKCLITIDTECSAGGWPQIPGSQPQGFEADVVGKIRGKEFGIRHIMDTLEEHSLAGEFFIEPFCSYKLGISPLRDICQEVLSRNHGVSLHLHPRWKLALHPELTRMSDSMCEYGVDGQEALLREGLELLSQCGVHAVHAFRAGNLRGNLHTYEAMRRVGVPISSNFCGAWDETMPSRFGLPRTCNDVTAVNGIVEIPITSFHDFPLLRPRHLRLLQIAAVSKVEFSHVFAAAIRANVRFVTVLLHTFEWIGRTRSSSAVIHSRVLDRFHHVCKWLADHRNHIPVCRFADVDVAELRAELQAGSGSPEVPIKSADTCGAGRFASHVAARLIRASAMGW